MDSNQVVQLNGVLNNKNLNPVPVTTFFYNVDRGKVITYATHVVLNFHTQTT